MTQSLFVIGLPRTFSTRVYQLASHALELRQPTWVMDGEVLNVDRYWHYHGLRFDESAKFTTPARDPQLVSKLHEFLTQVTITEGWIYKDVTQPFVLAQWRGLEQFRVLKLQRELADIAYAMLRRGWFYPQNAAVPLTPMPRVLALARRVTPFDYSGKLHSLFRSHYARGVIEGLVRAEQVLETIPGLPIAYKAIVQDESVLHQALQELYPQSNLEPFHYMDAAFVRAREQVARRRETTEYQRLCQRIEQLRANYNIA